MKTLILCGAMVACMAGCTPDKGAVVVIEEGHDALIRLGDILVCVIRDGESRTVPYSLFTGIPEEEMAKVAPADTLILDRQWFHADLVNSFSVDTGMGESRVTLGARSKILLTHGHGDHVGGLLSEKWEVSPEAKIYMSKPEIAYWLEPEQKDSPAAKMLALYGERVIPFDFDTEVLPGVWARDASGHTPGSTVFETEDVLFVGDILHCAALQFPRPEICASFDVDKPAAVAMRKHWLSKAAESGKPIAASHLPFPGIGTVKEDGNGGFTFTPLP